MRQLDDIRAVFDGVDDFTVGAEEELLILDASSLDLAPTAASVRAWIDEPLTFQSELSAAQVEIASGVHRGPLGVVSELRSARRRLITALGGQYRIAGMGAHCFTRSWDMLSGGGRYQELAEEQQLGARLGAMAGGLHIHVAVSGSDRALAVYNALRAVTPLFIAIAGNAPFIAGHDSGLATVRPKLCDALPRQGVGPRFRSWEDVESLVRWGKDTGAVTDASHFWWECRLNLRLGTVELRAPDAQAALTDTYALIAMAYATVVDLCERYDSGDILPVFDTAQIRENRWRAARYGIAGEMIDLHQRRMVSTRTLVQSLLDQIEPPANRHSASLGLDYARSLAERDVPNQRRQLAATFGTRGLMEHIADETENLPSMNSPEPG